MLLSADVKEAAAFYARLLGLEVTADIGWFVGLKSPQGAFEMSLCAMDHDSVPSSLQRPSDGVVLAFEVHDVDCLVGQLASDGVTLLTEPVDEPWGQRHVYVSAPDGVALDLFQAIEPDLAWMKEHGFA